MEMEERMEWNGWNGMEWNGWNEWKMEWNGMVLNQPNFQSRCRFAALCLGHIQTREIPVSFQSFNTCFLPSSAKICLDSNSIHVQLLLAFFPTGFF